MKMKTYKKRKFLSVLICAVLLSTLSVSVCAAESNRTLAVSSNLRSSKESSNAQTVLSIDHNHVYEGMEKAYKYGYTPTIADGKATIILPLLADGIVKDNRITASVNLGKTDASPFVYKNYRKSFSLEKKQIDGTKETQNVYYVRFDLELSQDRINGTYPVVLEMTGKNEQGKSFSQSFTIYLTISDGASGSSLGNDTVNGNVNGSIGNGTSNGSVGGSTGNDALNGNNNVGQDDGSIYGGTGNALQSGDATGVDGSAAGVTDGSVDGAGADSGSTGESAPTSQPIVLVSGCSLAPGTVTAGEEFSATVFLKNTNQKKNVQNMVVTVTYDTTMFTSKDDSDTIYISSLKKGEVMELPLTFVSNQNLADGTYKIDLAMSYDNSEASTLSSAGSIYIPVKQKLRVELTMPNIAKNVIAGDTLPLTFQVMNLGRSKIYNVRCEISGYGLLPTNTGFVGDMEPGTSGEAGVNLFIGTKDQTEGYSGTELYGDTSGLVTLYYEDADGEEYTEEYSFTTCIEKAIVSGGSSSEADEKTVGQWWISIVVAAAIIAAVLGWIMIRKRKQI